MRTTRSAAILVVVFGLLGLAGPAAATSRLTATPPVTLTSPAPTQPPTGPAQSPATPAKPAQSRLARTGSDIPTELLLAVVLVAAGGILRLRWSSNPS